VAISSFQSHILLFSLTPDARLSDLWSPEGQLNLRHVLPWRSLFLRGSFHDSKFLDSFRPPPRSLTGRRWLANLSQLRRLVSVGVFLVAGYLPRLRDLWLGLLRFLFYAPPSHPIEFDCICSKTRAPIPVPDLLSSAEVPAASS